MSAVSAAPAALVKSPGPGISFTKAHSSHGDKSTDTMAIDKTHIGMLIDSISMDKVALEDSMDMDNDGVGRRAHEVDDLKLHDILDLGDQGKRGHADTRCNRSRTEQSAHPHRQDFRTHNHQDTQHMRVSVGLHFPQVIVAMKTYCLGAPLT